MNLTLFTLSIFLVSRLTRGIPLLNNKLENNKETETLLHSYQNEITSLKQEIAAIEEMVTQIETKNSNLVKVSKTAVNDDGGLMDNHIINKRCK